MSIRLLDADFYDHPRDKKAVNTFLSVFKLFLFFSSSQDKFPQRQTSNFNIKISQ